MSNHLNVMTAVAESLGSGGSNPSGVKSAWYSPMPSAVDGPGTVVKIQYVGLTAQAPLPMFSQLGDFDGSASGTAQYALNGVRRWLTRRYNDGFADYQDVQNASTFHPDPSSTSTPLFGSLWNDSHYSPTSLDHEFIFDDTFTTLDGAVSGFDFTDIWAATGVLIGSMPAYTGTTSNQYVIGYWVNRFPSVFVAVDGGFTAAFNNLSGPTAIQDVNVAADIDGACSSTTSPSPVINYDGELYPIMNQGTGAPGINIQTVTLTAASPFITLGGANATTGLPGFGAYIASMAVSRGQVKALVPVDYVVTEESREADGQTTIKQLVRKIASGHLATGEILEVPMATILASRGGPGLPCITNGIAVQETQTRIYFNTTPEEYYGSAGITSGAIQFVTDW